MAKPFSKNIQTCRSVPLFYWQYLVLGAVSGVFAHAFFVHALLCFFFVFLLVALLYKDRRFLRLVLLVSVFWGSFAYAEWRKPVQSAQSMQYYSERFDPMQEREFCGKVQRVQGASDRRLRVTLSDVHIKEEGTCTHGGMKLEGNVLYTWDRAFAEKKRPAAGQFLQAKAKLRPFYGDLQAYYNRQNIWYGAWNYGNKNMFRVYGEGDFWASWRENLRFSFANLLFAKELGAENVQNALKTPEGQAKAVFMALFFGDKFYLTQSTLNDFNSANLLHSLALSGQHLSLAGVLTLVLLFIAERFCPFLYERTAKPVLAAFAGIGFGFLYCWLGSAPYSLLRAYAMLCVGAFFYVRAKEITLLDILFYALAFFVCAEPLSLFDLGVQLSFLCVFAIAYLLPFLRCAYDMFFCSWKKPWGKIGFSVFSLFAVSFVIQIVLAPLLIVYFGQVSWFFVLNVLWLPLLTFWVMPLGLLGFLCMAFPFADFFLQLAGMPVVRAVHFFDVLFSSFSPFIQFLRPMALEFLGFYVLVLVFCYAAKRRSLVSDAFVFLGMLCLFLPVFVRIFADKPDLFVSMLDVGQGQAVYAETKEKRLLFDTGGTSSVRFNAGRDIAAKYLTQNREPSLDMLIASHDDSDHINGLHHLLRTFSVGGYYESAVTVSKKTYAKKILDRELAKKGMRAEKLGAGDVLDLGGGYALKILYPPRKGDEIPSIKPEDGKAHVFGMPKYSANNASVAALLTHGEKSLVLFCGDSEKDVLEQLVMHYGTALRAEILVLPHHGSPNSYSEAFYEAVNPRSVWVSCGKFNYFRFPSEKILAYFAKRQVPVYSTADVGDVYFTHENGEILPFKKTFLQELFSVL